MCFFLFFKLKHNYTHFPLFFLNFPILIIIVASVFSLIVVTHIYSLHKYINKIYSLSIVLLCVYDFPILNKELQATKEYRVHKKIVFPRKENTKWLPNRCIFFMIFVICVRVCLHDAYVCELCPYVSVCEWKPVHIESHMWMSAENFACQLFIFYLMWDKVVVCVCLQLCVTG